MDRKPSHHSYNTRHLMNQSATRSTSASTYKVSKKNSPERTYKYKNPYDTETPINLHKEINPRSPERSRRSSREYVNMSRSPQTVIGHRGGMHVLTPKEEFFKGRTAVDNLKTRSPQSIIECGSYKPICRPRIQKELNMSHRKDHCDQTNSKIYTTQIPRSTRPKREIGTNAPEYGRYHRLSRTGSKIPNFPKSISREMNRETGGIHQRQRNETAHHSPRIRSPDNLRTRSPQKLYRPRSRENVYAQINRNEFSQNYENNWPIYPEDTQTRRLNALRSRTPDRSRYPRVMQPPPCPEIYDYQASSESESNLRGCVETICRPGSRERSPRRHYSPNTHDFGSCGLYGPCSPKGRHSPGQQENIVGDYKGQGGDGAQTLIHDASDECSCPAAIEKKLKEVKSKKGQGDSLWEHWKKLGHKKKRSKPPEPDNLQKVLRRLGEMRAYHWMLVCAAAPLAFMWAYVLYGQMFVMATPDHFCATKQLKAAVAVSGNVEFRRKWSIPMVDGEYDKCNKIERDYTKITNKSDQTEIEMLLKTNKTAANIPCDAGWEFIYESVPYSTLTSDGQLVCMNAIKKVFPHSMFYLGAVLGSVSFGVVGDEFGRLPALVASTVVTVLGSLVSTTTTDVWYFGLARLLAGLGYDTCFMAMHILVLEYVGPHYRAQSLNVVIAVFFGLGGLLLPSIASLIANWKSFLYATSLPMLMVVSFPVFLPESHRWLLLRGKLKRALRIIAKMQKAAKREVPQRDLDRLIYEVVNHPASGNIRDAMSSPYISAMVSIFALLYLVVMMLFETLVLLTEHTGVAFFTAFRISAAMELPAGLIVAFLVNKFGRRLLTISPMFIAGILTCSAAAVSKGAGLTAMTTVARLTAAMARNTLYLWAAEAMPTGARAAGCGIAHAGGHLGCMFAPLLAHQVGNKASSWPLIVMGLLTILVSIIVSVLPETMHKSLPQKISVSKKRFEQSYQNVRERLTRQKQQEHTEKEHRHHEKDELTQPHPLPHPSPSTAPAPHAAHGDAPAPAPRDPLRHAMPRQWRTSDGII